MSPTVVDLTDWELRGPVAQAEVEGRGAGAVGTGAFDVDSTQTASSSPTRANSSRPEGLGIADGGSELCIVVACARTTHPISQTTTSASSMIISAEPEGSEAQAEWSKLLGGVG